MKKVMALCLTVSLVAGCATEGQQATTEGTAGGAALGALLGAGVGAALGGGRGAAIGAGIGAVLGAMGGYSYAEHVKQRNAQLAGKENDLNTRISYAEGVNQDLQDANKRLDQDLVASQQEVDTLAAKIQKNQVTQQQLEKERLALNTKVKNAENQLQLASGQLDDMKKFRATQPQTSAELDSKIAKMEAQVEQLRTNTNTLASLGQKI